jgi:6-phosphofructokinase
MKIGNCHWRRRLSRLERRHPRRGQNRRQARLGNLGIIGGYDGLLPPQNFRVLDYKALDGLLVRGGTILGTANRGRFSAKTGHGETRQFPQGTAG